MAAAALGSYFFTTTEPGVGAWGQKRLSHPSLNFSHSNYEEGTGSLAWVQSLNSPKL